MHSADMMDRGMMSHMGQRAMGRDFIHLKLTNCLFLESSSYCFQTEVGKPWEVQRQITGTTGHV